MKNRKWLVALGLVCLIGVSMVYASGCRESFSQGDVHTARMEGYDAGFESGYDRGYRYGYRDAVNEYRTPIPWLLGEVYRLSGGDDYAFGYNVAAAEGQRTHPLFFYNLIKHEYTDEAGGFGERLGIGIDFDYEDFIRGYVAYGEYLRDVFVPSWQEDVPDQADYIEEMYREAIAYYLSVEGDAW